MYKCKLDTPYNNNALYSSKVDTWSIQHMYDDKTLTAWS